MQFAHRFCHDQGAQGRKRGGIVGTIGYANAGTTGIQRHLQVVRGVANHQHTLGRHVKFGHQLLQHQRVGLTSGLVCGARTIKHATQGGAVQRIVQAPAAFARGHSEPMPTGAQILQEWQNAFKQADFILQTQVMVTVAVA